MWFFIIVFIVFVFLALCVAGSKQSPPIDTAPTTSVQPPAQTTLHATLQLHFEPTREKTVVPKTSTPISHVVRPEPFPGTPTVLQPRPIPRIATRYPIESSWRFTSDAPTCNQFCFALSLGINPDGKSFKTISTAIDKALEKRNKLIAEAKEKKDKERVKELKESKCTIEEDDLEDLYDYIFQNSPVCKDLREDLRENKCKPIPGWKPTNQEAQSMLDRLMDDPQIMIKCPKCGHVSEFLAGCFSCPQCDKYFGTLWIELGPDDIIGYPKEDDDEGGEQSRQDSPAIINSVANNDNPLFLP